MKVIVYYGSEIVSRRIFTAGQDTADKEAYNRAYEESADHFNINFLPVQLFLFPLFQVSLHAFEKRPKSGFVLCA